VADPGTAGSSPAALGNGVREALSLMTTAGLLSHLRSRDITVRLEGERLLISAPPRTLSTELRKELEVRKPEIVAFLSDSVHLVTPELPPIEQIPRDGELPLSFSQMRLWFLEQLSPGSAANNILTAARFHGNLDISILQKSLSEIVRRHEALRTAFPEVDGQPNLVILPAAPVSSEMADLTGLPVEERESKAREIAEAAAKKRFDLTNGPLLRTQLIRVHEDDHVLLLTVHHAVFDQWSTGIFWREFCALYSAFRSSHASPLPDLAIQYADFAAWQRRCLEGPARESHLSYWKGQLQGCMPSLRLPTDSTRTDSQERGSARKTLRLSPEVNEALTSLAHEEGASLFMVLLAAFKVLLYRLSGQDDILVGTPIAGRNRPEIEGLIGCFVNTVVLRTRLAGSRSFRELLTQVRTTVLDAYEHQDMPFEELVGEFDVQRDLSRTPLFQVLFNHLNVPVAPAQIPGLEIEPHGDTMESKYDLALHSAEHNGSIELVLLYNTLQFDERRMEILLDRYSVLLDQICADPSKPLEEYLVLTFSGAGIVTDPTMPLTLRGKVDRAALALRGEQRIQQAEEYVPPSTHVERVITGIWSEVLEVAQVGVYDNFFRLGGHSFSAIRVIAKVRSALGIDLPLRCIFVEPTIAGLAKHIRYDVSTYTYRYVSRVLRWSCLVPGQPLGSRTPFFFLAGYMTPDDAQLMLSRLSFYLGLDQPVFGFRPRWLEDGGKGYSSVEEVVGEFLEELRTCQPKGPYLLGGHCVSGVVALEIARQLIREGEEVKLLALVDTERPTSIRSFWANMDLLSKRRRHIAEVVAEIIRPNDRSRKDLLSDLLRRKLGIAQPGQAGGAQPDRLSAMRIAYRRLIFKHSLEKYPGSITLIVNEQQHQRDRDFGWKGFAEGGLAIHELPGDHDTLMTLHGKKLSQLLLNCIDDALPESGRQSQFSRNGGT
jgi:thioesterase domain-containing protein